MSDISEITISMFIAGMNYYYYFTQFTNLKHFILPSVNDFKQYIAIRVSNYSLLIKDIFKSLFNEMCIKHY